MKDWLTGFAIGFAATAVAKAAKSNKQDALNMANADFATRQRMLMAGDQNALYNDWKKYGPRWQNGYFTPMD